MQSTKKARPGQASKQGPKRARAINAFRSTLAMLLRSKNQNLTSSPVRSESRRRGLSWTDAESKIRKLHRAALDDLTEEESRRLYSLELSASRHAGDNPRRLLEKAKQVAGGH